MGPREATRRAIIAAERSSDVAHQAWREIVRAYGGGHPLEAAARQAADLAADNTRSARRLWSDLLRSQGLMGGACGKRGCGCNQDYAPLTHLAGLKLLTQEVR